MRILKNNWYKLFYVKDLRFLLVIILICLVASAKLGTMLPKQMTNLFESYDSINKFKDGLFILFFIFLGEYVTRVIYQLAVNKYIQYVVHQTRNYCFDSWLLSYETKREEDDFPLGEVLSRIMNDTEAVRELVTTGSFGIFIDLLFVVSCLLSFLSLEAISGSTIMTAELIACFFLIWGSKYMARAFIKVRKTNAHLSRAVADVSAGYEKTYFENTQNYSSKKIKHYFDIFLKEQLKANIWDAGYYSIAESLYPLLLALVGVIYSNYELGKAAVLAALIDLIQRSIAPIKDVTGKVANIQRAYTGLVRIDEFTTKLRDGQLSSGKTLHEKVDLKTLHVLVNKFSYPSKDNKRTFELSDIEFFANNGELIGIVGLSGSGKSTLLKILSARVIPEDGYVKITDQNNEEIIFDNSNLQKLQHYREQVSIVSQDSHVFSESLKFNITLESGNAQTESEFNEFWNHCLSEIPYLKTWGVTPETQIDVTSISLGQKQFISSLRACFLQKPIVLFDEISSGMDSQLEMALRKMVLIVQKKALTFIVAHRIETIVLSDQILVMHNGRLKDIGKHSELLDRNDIYQQFISELNDQKNTELNLKEDQ